jgi:hypothetical protein
MALRRQALVLLVIGMIGASVPVAPAAAKVERIMGGVRCAITEPVITFAPGLRNRFHIEGTQSGRGPSTADFTAGLSGCTDPSTGPAVAGIDHGTLHGTGKVPGSNCEKLSNLKLNTTITWMTAAGTVVGDTRVKLGLAITVHDFDSPRTVDFAGTAKRPSHVFPRDPVAFSLTTTASSFGISANCFKFSLDSLGFQDGTLAADPPS